MDSGDTIVVLGFSLLESSCLFYTTGNGPMEGTINYMAMNSIIISFFITSKCLETIWRNKNWFVVKSDHSKENFFHNNGANIGK